MQLDLNEYSPGAIYHLMTQTLVPRPVAWVLSENDNGSLNLAPFSYFNAISSNPPLVMISVGKKPDGSDKDTHRNIHERKYFTIHIADESLLDALNESSATLDANDSEIERLGLQTTTLGNHPLPRLKDAKIAYACELDSIHLVGNTPQAVIYGEVKTMFIDDSITTTNDKSRLKVHTDKLNPVARLGASEFMRCGEIVQKRRPA